MIIKNEENMFFHLVSCISPNWVFSSSPPRPSLLLDTLADTEARENLKAKESRQKHKRTQKSKKKTDKNITVVRHARRQRNKQNKKGKTQKDKITITVARHTR